MTEKSDNTPLLGEANASAKRSNYRNSARRLRNSIAEISLQALHYDYRRWCGYRRSTCLFWIYIIAYVTYLIVGGLIFSTIESQYEWEARMELRDTVEQFLEDNPTLKS